MAGPLEDASAARLNARAVEFIAKPGTTDELRGLLCQAVTPLLGDRTGFMGSIILTEHEEQRRVVMMTLWGTEETVGDRWEETPLVRELLSPVIDAWSRIRTYNVELMETTEAQGQVVSLPIC